MENGQHAMFSVKETPWHRLGTVVTEFLTSEKAIKEAKLDWTVTKQQVQYHNLATGQMEDMPNKHHVINGSNGKSMGIVSGQYTPFQNREAFEFMDSLVNGDYSNAMYETAGALGNGETVWMMINMGLVNTVGKDDTVLPYLVLTNNHTGKNSLKVFFTPIRVVCQNTLMCAMGNAQNTVSIRHMGNLEEKIQDAQQAMGMAIKANETFTEQADILSMTPIKSENAAIDYFTETFFPNQEEDKVLSTQATHTLDAVMDLFEGGGKGSDMKTAHGTAWGAYNAAIEFLDYHSHSARKTPAKALTSNLNGQGANTKVRAFNNALELVA